MSEFNSDRARRYQLVENHNWIQEFGVSYALGVDGVGYVMVLLTAALMPILLARVAGATWTRASTPRPDAAAAPRSSTCR